MIEMTNDNPLVGLDPYKDSVGYVTEMSAAHQDSMIRLLESIEANIERLSNYNSRQLSKEAPTMIDMGPLSGKPGAGSVAGAVYAVTQRFRITNIVLGGGAAADNFRLKVGQNPYNFFGTGTLQSLPFEIEIDRGIDINVADITSPANVAWTFMLFGYPE